MKGDFVTYELAIKLKEKGYPQNGFHYYNEKGCIDIPAYNLSDEDMSDTVAPQIHEVLKWLREEKKIYIMIDRSFAMNQSWHYSICVDDDFDNIVQQASIANKSWEQSALDAIEYVIDNLIL